MKIDTDVTVGQHAAGCMQWSSLFLIVFFVSLPWSGPLFVDALRFVLEGLNSFGAGR